MEIKKVEGIVLTETNYSESSKILNVLTKEYGRIGIISKGCRKIKSKLRGVSSKLIYGNFNIYYKENGLSTLISVDVINSFNNIQKDLKKISYAAYILELIDQVSKQNNNEELFNLFKNTLLKIEEGYNEEILTIILQLQALTYLGVSPSIDGCSICGNNKNIITLSSSSGGYVCKDCYKNDYIVKDITIKLIRMFYYVDVEKISKLDIKEENLKEINYFLDDYYDRYTGIYLKSKKFLKSINRI